MNNEGNLNRFGVDIGNTSSLGIDTSTNFEQFLQIRRLGLFRQKLNISSELLILKQLSWHRQRGRIADGKQDRLKQCIQNEDDA